MTEENKKLLLKDLSSRLPYKVKVEIKNVCKIGTLEEIDLSWEEMSVAARNENGELNGYDFNLAKPYLFPLSSMTEEQKEEYCSLQQKVIYNSKGLINSDVMEYINWCYKNHIDINNLIPMGLAIDATGLNIY